VPDHNVHTLWIELSACGWMHTQDASESCIELQPPSFTSFLHWFTFAVRSCFQSNNPSLMASLPPEVQQRYPIVGHTGTDIGKNLLMARTLFELMHIQVRDEWYLSVVCSCVPCANVH
jgi:hypothetical protein